jgi:small subunit ribosomal protein S6
MKAYELLFFVNPTLDEESREGAMTRLEAAITTQGGVVDKTENWGKRKLAFEVEGLADGDYTLVDFHAEPNSIAELDRILRISDVVVRHMIVKRDDRD